MSIFKEQCINLRRAGYTLPEIVRKTGRSKTSVYSHIYNIPLSDAKIKAIRLASGIRFKNIGLARKGISEKDFKRFSQWNRETVILIAHLIFDGTISRTSCVYNNRNMPLLDQVENCMKEIYGYEPKRYLNKVTGVSRISYHNVTLATYLEEKAKQLLQNIYSLSKPLKREFIKAFFDDEGCMDFRPKRNLRQIRGYQKNTTLLGLIQKLLEEFTIKSSVVQPNEITVRGKENLQKFQEEINFSPNVRLNGSRSNSIWKKSLEKRVLLDKAIKSFKLKT